MSAPSIEQFVHDNVPGRCSLASALIEHALINRGYEVQRYNQNVVTVPHPSGLIAFDHLNGPDSSVVARSVRALRDVQQLVLARAGVPVPAWATFSAGQTEQAAHFAATELGWPVAVRPARLAPPKGASDRVSTDEEFDAAWRRAMAAYDGRTRRRVVIVEEAALGARVHVFVVRSSVVAATQVVPAHVVGDGQASVAELIDRRNVQRARNPFLRRHPVPRRLRRLDALQAAGRALTDVPAAGERVELGTSPTVVSGGDLVDVTEQLPPHQRELAVRAVSVLPGLEYAAVDIVDAGADRCVVTRVDGFPQPWAHFPSVGAPRDVAGAIVEHYLGAPRWIATRQTATTPPADGSLRVEPLLLSSAPG
ncbi:hypothetical protein [Phytoactinopolyspora halotolerans]|uniref:ATP-grasp domain-containing protein n=1 Tax=Phytoactinopolyspora halotolerans TaxID=1981512 RepID=A0A6L9S8P8_9ACTN|nr:hypothetical protein [Phytoactinopolyspora halotolerans]NEE01437.1 hypothetical protein [Phytoactinopolyspora halotolerans]